MTWLKIEIAGPSGRKAYKPGDVVSGHVDIDLSYEAAQNAKRIEIAFSGRSEINCRKNAHHSNKYSKWHWNSNLRTIFFDELQVICVYDPSHLPVVGNSRWPFSFVFPAVASSSQQLRNWESHSIHNNNIKTTTSEPDTPLPPSFYYGTAWYSDMVFEAAEGYVKVLYELEARLITTQETKTSHCKRSLPFMPYNGLPVGQPSYEKKMLPIRCESRRLLPNFNQASFRSRAKSLVLKIPVSTFNLIIEVPKFLIAEEPLPLYLGVQYDIKSSTTTELPPVYLRSVTVGYHEIVHVGLRQPVCESDKTEMLVSSSQSIPLQHRFTKGSEVRITERVNLRDFISPKSLVVDGAAFETFNIRRNLYIESVALVVTCAGNDYPISAGFRGDDGAYSVIPPPAPPKSMELASLNRLAPEAYGRAINETEGKVAAGEVASEPIYEMGARNFQPRMLEKGSLGPTSKGFPVDFETTVSIR